MAKIIIPKKITVVGTEGVKNIILPDNDILTALDAYYRKARGVRVFHFSNNPLTKKD